MKTTIRLMIASASLFLPIVVAGPVFAVAEPTPTTTTEQTTEQKKTEQTTTVKPTVEEQKKQQLERIQKHKDEAKVRLTTAEQKRIKDRCKNAQGSLRSLQGRITGLDTSRSQAYTKLVERLDGLVAKLDEKGTNTGVLKSEIETLKSKIAVFNADLLTYKQNVADLAEMDCATDPTAFKASLETARTGLKKLRTDAGDIKTYVNETIKATLKTIRTEISGDKKQSANTEATGEN